MSDTQTPREDARSVLAVVSDRMDEFAYDEVSCAIDTLADALDVAEASLRQALVGQVQAEHAEAQIEAGVQALAATFWGWRHEPRGEGDWYSAMSIVTNDMRAFLANRAQSVSAPHD